MPTDVRSLFNRHIGILSDDCTHRLRHRFGLRNPTQDQAHRYALQEIARLLANQGRTLRDYNLPEPGEVITGMEAFDRLEVRRRQLDCQQEYMANRDKVRRNPDQERAVASIEDAVDTGRGGLFYLDGPGGSGKTFVERLCLAYVRSKGWKAMAVASTGIAALLLPDGKTAHFQFKIPLEVKADMVCGISAQTQDAEAIRHLRLLVWDEVFAQHNQCVAAVDRLFRDLRQNERPFGGVTVLFAGKYDAGERR